MLLITHILIIYKFLKLLSLFCRHLNAAMFNSIKIECIQAYTNNKQRS